VRFSRVSIVLSDCVVWMASTGSNNILKHLPLTMMPHLLAPSLSRHRFYSAIIHEMEPLTIIYFKIKANKSLSLSQMELTIM